MRLKVKNTGWSAGRPIAIINNATARKIGARVDERIAVSCSEGVLIATIDTSAQLVDEKHILLSTEIIDFLNLKNNQIVKAEVAEKSNSTQIINKKLMCKRLSKKEIYTIINSIVKNELTEIEIAFFISSIYKCGMSFDEIIFLTNAMFKTGKKLKLKHKYVVDKHSIGGIAGNRTTPIIVSICATQDLVFPKTSSRAITSAAGTADTIEVVCNVNFKIPEIKKIIKKTNACLVWGGSLGFAPADDKLIRVERLINIDPEPNLLASIMAKKLSVSSKYVLIDIPYGEFAKVTKKRGIDLKKKFEKLGGKFGLKIKVVLTDGSQPIGNGIGPALEMKDVISVLETKGPKDLTEKSLFLAGQLFELCGKAKKGQGKKMARNILNSGKALDKFYEIVKAQGGEVKKIPHQTSLAKYSKTIKVDKDTKIKIIDNKKINLLARIAGCPGDKKAGVYLHKHVGDVLKKSEPLITIYAHSQKRLEDAVAFYKENKIIELK